jgi:hypothetical protein
MLIMYNGCVLKDYPCYYVYCDVDVEVSDYDPRFIVIRWQIYFKFLNPDVKVDVNNIAFWRHGDVTVERYPTDKNVSKAITKIIREKISERFQTTGERVVYIRNSEINKNPKYIDPTVWRV